MSATRKSCSVTVVLTRFILREGHRRRPRPGYAGAHVRALASPAGMSAKVAGWQRSARTAAVVLAVLLAITLAVSLTVARAVDRDRRANLERRADVAVEAIERRLAGYTETLYAIRGLFEERRRVTRRAYRA